MPLSWRLYPRTPWSATASAWQRPTGVSVVQDRLNSIPDGLPFGAIACQVEFRQHAFEPVDHFGTALKPRIGATLVKKGFDFVHRFAGQSFAR
jgi:hypothetical protein